MKRKLLIVICCVLVIVLAVAAALYFNLPKPLTLSNANFDLSSIKDGTYQGECDNSIVYAKVEVEVYNREITSINILEHKNGLGSPAEAIISDVLSEQSVEVDAVSGATVSSQTILKAIENALSK